MAAHTYTAVVTGFNVSCCVSSNDDEELSSFGLSLYMMPIHWFVLECDMDAEFQGQSLLDKGRFQGIATHALSNRSHAPYQSFFFYKQFKLLEE